MAGGDNKLWENELVYIRFICNTKAYGAFGNSEDRFRVYVAGKCVEARKNGCDDYADMFEKSLAELLPSRSGQKQAPTQAATSAKPSTAQRSSNGRGRLAYQA